MTMKGTKPPKAMLGAIPRYQGFGGICLAMAFVRDGCSQAGFLKPNHDPATTNGSRINSQIVRSARRVPKGIAEDDD